MNAAAQEESQDNQSSPEEIVGASVHSAVTKAQDYLLRLQRHDGHWCGELEGDTILESEYILTMYFIGRSGEAKAHKAANYLVEKSLPEGGWAIYPGGPRTLVRLPKPTLLSCCLGTILTLPTC